MPSTLTYDDIKDLTYQDLLDNLRDAKIATGINGHLGKLSRKDRKDRKKIWGELLTPKEFDAIVRDALTPEELATMMFDVNGLVSMMTPAAPRLRRLDRLKA